MSDASQGWFLTHGGDEVHGPFTMAALVEAARAGNIVSATHLRHETHTAGQWLPAGRIRPVAEALRPQQAPGQPAPAQQPQQPKQPAPSTGSPKALRPSSTSPSQRPAENHLPEAAAPTSEVSLEVQHPQRLGRGKDTLVVPATLGAALGALFDFRFRYFVTPWIVKITWATCVVLSILALLVLTVVYVIQPIVVSAESQAGSGEMIADGTGTPGRSPGDWQFQPPTIMADNLGRVITYCMTVLFFGFGLLYLRMFLEAAIVLFRIARDLSDLKDLAKEKEQG